MNPLTFLFVVTGAFFFWSVNGFKGPFDSYMSKLFDNDKKYWRNLLTGLVFIVGLTTLLVKLTS